MKNTWLSENSLEVIKVALHERGHEIKEKIVEGKGSVVYALDNVSLVCKVRPYSKEAVKRVLFARAAYRFDKKRFPYLPIPDPNRKIEFFINSDELTPKSKDWETEAIITKERAFLATTHERLSPIRSKDEKDLLKLTRDIAEVLNKMYDLRFALHGIGNDDIMYSHSADSYVLADCSKVSRFIGNDLRFRYGDSRTSAPELFDYHYHETSSVYSLGCVLRSLVAEETNSEDDLTDKIDKINSAIHPAVILMGKKNLSPLVEHQKKYSAGFFRLINHMTSFYPEDRPMPDEVAKAARKLLELPTFIGEEADR